MKNVIKNIKTSYFLFKYNKLLKDNKVDSDNFIYNHLNYLTDNFKILTNQDLQKRLNKIIQNANDNNIDNIIKYIPNYFFISFYSNREEIKTNISTNKSKEIFCNLKKDIENQNKKQYFFNILLQTFALNEKDFGKYEKDLNDVNFLKEYIAYDYLFFNDEIKDRNILKNIYKIIKDCDELKKESSHILLNLFTRGKMVFDTDLYLKDKNIDTIKEYDWEHLLEFNKQIFSKLDNEEFKYLINIKNFQLKIGDDFDEKILYLLENKFITINDLSMNFFSFSINSDLMKMKNKNIDFFQMATNKNIFNEKDIEHIKKEIYFNFDIVNDKDISKLLTVLDKNIIIKPNNLINNVNFKKIIKQLMEKEDNEVRYDNLVHYLNEEQILTIKDLMDKEIINENQYFKSFFDKSLLEKQFKKIDFIEKKKVIKI